MGFTDRGKKICMDAVGGAARFIGLFLANDTELSGHGYARKQISAAQMTVSSAGVITGPANLVIYTANDGTAQRAMKVGLFASGVRGTDDAILEPEAITTPPAAPANGQDFRLSLTLNP